MNEQIKKQLSEITPLIIQLLITRYAIENQEKSELSKQALADVEKNNEYLLIEKLNLMKHLNIKKQVDKNLNL